MLFVDDSDTAIVGKLTLSSETTQVLISTARNQKVKQESYLTERKKEDLKLMVDGLCNTEIAEELFSACPLKSSRSTAVQPFQISCNTNCPFDQGKLQPLRQSKTLLPADVGEEPFL